MLKYGSKYHLIGKSDLNWSAKQLCDPLEVFLTFMLCDPKIMWNTLTNVAKSSSSYFSEY